MPTERAQLDSGVRIPNQTMLSAALFERWQHAWPPLSITGAIKTEPEDFLVVEQATHGERELADGPHLYLFVEKRGLTSTDLIQKLADANGLHRSSIGYAGMKDKVAVTRQWLSVPLEEAPPEVTVPDGVVELARLRTGKKLRRGWHDGNAFELVLRNLQSREGLAPASLRSAIDQRLEQIAEAGVPNYFGPQRFGHDNVSMAIAWLPRRRKERNAFRRGLHLSVLRSFLFNEVLSARVAEGWFAAGATEVDCLVSTGPLWGRGRIQQEQAVVEFEAAVLADYADIFGELEFAGLKQERRALNLQPSDLGWNWRDDTTLELNFGLPPGAYATSVLRELGAFQQPEPEPGGASAPGGLA